MTQRRTLLNEIRNDLHEIETYLTRLRFIIDGSAGQVVKTDLLIKIDTTLKDAKELIDELKIE